MKLFKSNAKVTAQSTAKKIRGQGMSEYMIIVALIAIAGIVTMSLFGETARQQVASMAQEIAGDTTNGAAQTKAAGATADDAGTNAAVQRNMGTFSGKQDTFN